VAKMISKIGTREQRKKLKPSGKPYFEELERGLDFGYRKGTRERKWVVRRLIVGERKYKSETIGAADDFADADGVEVLTYHQARDWARERTQALAEETRIASLGPAVTIRSAIEEYIAARDARERGHAFAGSKGLKKDARSRLKHVLADEKLAAKPLAALTDDDLATWRKGLRMEATSAQRVVNDLKAALNAAARSAKARLPANIRDTIKDGLRTENAAPAVAREAQVLTDADVRAIISAAWEVDAGGGWEGDLARIVLVLAATGARFSQVIRMKVADVQAERLMIPTSRKGRGEKQKTHVSVYVGDDVWAALSRATAGRKGSDPLFLRPHWRQIGPAKWEKGERGPWFAAAELSRPWRAIIARAGKAAGTVPYSLRHSWIVRGLGAGLPAQLVAAMADTSEAMVQRHYGHFVDDALGELAKRAVVPLTTAPATVHSIDERARA
jgi:integrase